ncbi:MAG: riboflavin synthase [Bacteroidia bacterium]|nr:riboflavin synthase [Bacteroidia bacterium]
MFTGIIEAIGEVVHIAENQSNLTFTLKSEISKELKIDQSVAHNGVCLTVEEVKGDLYKVTAIKETLTKTNLRYWSIGERVNLERSLTASQRIDGHFVQGHVDTVGICKEIRDENGSWVVVVKYEASSPEFFTVNKGSICLNGVSLTVVESKKSEIQVSIIPYTFEHTNFKHIRIGDYVNIEFDILGKYISALIQNK